MNNKNIDSNNVNDEPDTFKQMATELGFQILGEVFLSDNPKEMWNGLQGTHRYLASNALCSLLDFKKNKDK